MEPGHSYQSLGGSSGATGRCFPGARASAAAVLALLGAAVLLAASLQDLAWQPGRDNRAQSHGRSSGVPATAEFASADDVGAMLDGRLAGIQKQVDQLAGAVSALGREVLQVSSRFGSYSARVDREMEGLHGEIESKVGERQLGRMQAEIAGKADKQQAGHSMDLLQSQVTALNQAFSTLRAQAAHSAGEAQLDQAIRAIGAKVSDQYSRMESQMAKVAARSCRVCEKITGWDNSCGNGQCQCGVTCSGWVSMDSPSGSWSGELTEDQDGRSGGCRASVLLQCVDR